MRTAGLRNLRLASSPPPPRLWWFVLLWFLSLLLFRVPVSNLVSLALRDERYSHILLIPFISLGLIWLERNRIFFDSSYCPGVGIPLLLACVVLSILSRAGVSPFGENQSLFVSIFAIVLIWTALFILCFGLYPFRRALFPVMFLLLMVPLPVGLMDKAVAALQKGSAEAAFTLFKLAGVPVFRDGFQFSLPGVAIEVAEECSGIRSGVSLVISSILAGHLFLRSNWRRVCLILFTVPIVIFKNGLRIVTISWLGVYVDRGFLYGSLHKHGGLPFSLIALALMALLLFVLRKPERNSEISPDGPNPEFPLQPTVGT